MAQLVEFGDQAFHHAEHRLVDGRVDDLPGAASFPMMQRGEGAHAGVHGGKRIADADTDA